MSGFTDNSRAVFVPLFSGSIAGHDFEDACCGVKVGGEISMFKCVDSLIAVLMGSGLLLAGFAAEVSAQVRPNAPEDLTVEGGTSLPRPPTGAVFFDNFEFIADRAGAASSVFTSRGWSSVK
jgi:hypothetical protein